ncbi:MAG: hypothetical protein HYZ14_13625 [Bacteroidetes bacterium]|nr:hypothetical protein [Bacteroidota bacterium]
MPSFKFRVLIDTDSGNDVFRDIVISTKDNLEVFYHKIMEAFAFKGDQMASFYKSNEDWDKGQEITLVDMGMNDSAEPVLIMSDTSLHEIVTEPDQKMILVYDFMRMWCFLIELVETQTKTVSAPQIALSVGTAPKEESKSFDSANDLTYGETLDLGDDFDDIFSDDDDELDDDDLDGFHEETGESDYY